MATVWQAICPSPALRGVLDLNFTRFTLEAQMRVPVPLEVSMMSRAVLARTPLKQRIRDARGDNFTRSLVMFQVSHPTPNPNPDPHPNRTHGLRGLRHCSACSSLAERVRFCGGSTTMSLGSSCRSCGPKAGPPQAGHTLTSVVSDSFRAASLRSRCTRATPSAALAGPFSCPQRITAPGG